MVRDYLVTTFRKRKEVGISKGDKEIKVMKQSRVKELGGVTGVESDVSIDKDRDKDKEAKVTRLSPPFESKTAPITISRSNVSGVVGCVVGSSGSDKSAASLRRLVSDKREDIDIKVLNEYNESSNESSGGDKGEGEGKGEGVDVGVVEGTEMEALVEGVGIGEVVYGHGNGHSIESTNVSNLTINQSMHIDHNQQIEVNPTASSWYSWSWYSKQATAANMVVEDKSLEVNNTGKNSNLIEEEMNKNTTVAVEGVIENETENENVLANAEVKSVEIPITRARTDSWYSTIFSFVGSNKTSNINGNGNDGDKVEDVNKSPIIGKSVPTVTAATETTTTATTTPPTLPTTSPIIIQNNSIPPSEIRSTSTSTSWTSYFRGITQIPSNPSNPSNPLNPSNPPIHSRPSTPENLINEQQLPSKSPAPSVDIEPAAKKQKKIIRPNIVTPSLDESYPLYTQSIRIKSSLSKFSQYLLPALRDSSKTQYHDHPYRCAPHKIHNVVVIGVHGYFPARVVRALFGEPTGTSVKFANEAEQSVLRWADEKGYKIKVNKIALEGEGKVHVRVENLYQLLLNKLNLIKEADFIYFAAHSQGTPVAVHLLAKLITDGHIEKKRVSLLGMAGISLGPMSGLDQKLVMRAITSIESDSLMELFEFQKPQAEQSKSYIESLKTIISHNAKIVFVGSLDDQLVPLYSSTCCHISHPNIYRAVYIDGEDVAPEFISNLLTVALKLRNLGSTDHGVIRELSGALPGAMTGKGHSKIYNEPQVYDLTLRYALETTDIGETTTLQVDSNYEIPKPNPNPYLLPWAMRGLLNESLKRSYLVEKVNELYDEFNSWKPESKVLKDVKYRLSAIQSKL